MDLAELIRARRTIQTFAAGDVPESVVKEALELSLWSLNHRLTFPWIYKIASREQRLALAELQIEGKSRKGPLSDAVKTSMRTNFMNAAHYVALGLKRESDPGTAKEDYATLSCSMQIASLVLWEKGIGSKWTTSGFSVHAKTYEILGLSPNEVVLEGGLLIGKFEKAPPAAERPSLSEVLR